MTIIIKKNSKPKKLNFNVVKLAAEALITNSTPDQINATLAMCANAELGPVEVSQIINILYSRTHIGKKALKQQFELAKQYAGLLPGDAGLAVARNVRDEHFNGGKHVLRSLDGRFFNYTGKHWVPVGEGHIRKLVFTAANHAFASSGEKSLSTLVSKAFACFKDVLGVDETIDDLPDGPQSIINVLNGEIWISPDGTLERRPHNPASRLTYCLPVEYDAEATCPNFSQALSDIFKKSQNSAEMSRHFMELFGYVIQPIRDIPHFVLLIGQGANGKTKLLETIQKLLGPDATLNDSIAKFTRDSFNIAYLQGKLVFIDDDVCEGTVLDDGLIKKISEAKTVSARRAYGREKVTFICRAIPVIAGNSYPKSRDVSYGMARRALVFPFDRVFTLSEQDTTLFPAIWEEELPGVLNCALAGLKRVRDRGNKFDPPEDCIAAREEFFRHANPLIAFLDGQCEKAPDSKLRLMDLRAALKAWASEQGITKPSSADNPLKRKLEGLGFKVSKINGYHTVWGLKLL